MKNKGDLEIVDSPISDFQLCSDAFFSDPSPVHTLIQKTFLSHSKYFNW